ncbi:hypothetical protein DFH06DRAFT_1137504 [Mycena polygramma]|nr:hypothetical protein DFH06DRAFT_1137504 [Mycena polygramma]
MHFSALLSLTALSCLALVAAVPPLANINPDIVTQAQTSEREISSITKHHKHHKSKCTGKCGDKTCDIKDGCSCADKFCSNFASDQSQQQRRAISRLYASKEVNNGIRTLIRKVATMCKTQGEVTGSALFGTLAMSFDMRGMGLREVHSQEHGQNESRE